MWTMDLRVEVGPHVAADTSALPLRLRRPRSRAAARGPRVCRRPAGGAGRDPPRAPARWPGRHLGAVSPSRGLADRPLALFRARPAADAGAERLRGHLRASAGGALRRARAPRRFPGGAAPAAGRSWLLGALARRCWDLRGSSRGSSAPTARSRRRPRATSRWPASEPCPAPQAARPGQRAVLSRPAVHGRPRPPRPRRRGAGLRATQGLPAREGPARAEPGGALDRRLRPERRRRLHAASARDDLHGAGAASRLSRRARSDPDVHLASRGARVVSEMAGSMDVPAATAISNSETCGATSPRIGVGRACCVAYGARPRALSRRYATRREGSARIGLEDGSSCHHGSGIRGRDDSVYEAARV